MFNLNDRVRDVVLLRDGNVVGMTEDLLSVFVLYDGESLAQEVPVFMLTKKPSTNELAND